MEEVSKIMEELKGMGKENIKQILMKHGVKEPLYGVKVEDMKLIQKRLRKNYEISMALFETGNADAMYLAGLVADESKMTEENLSLWVATAKSTNIQEYTVPWIAAESGHGFKLALDWINHPSDAVKCSGWATLSSVVSITKDEKLDIKALADLMLRVKNEIHTCENRVKYNMNCFIIAVGCYVAPLTNLALDTAKEIGMVSVDVGDTSCKIPYSVEYIEKVRGRNSIGKKKKQARC